MSKYATNSCQAREALAERRPYTTGGAMRATEGPAGLPWGNRLPADWRERYNADADRMTYIVWSYDTPIAWVLDNGDVVRVDHKWSVTTSGHQGMLYALTANRADIADAAVRERQAERDRRAERAADLQAERYVNLPARTRVPEDALLWDAMRSTPEDTDALIASVQGMLVR